MNVKRSEVVLRGDQVQVVRHGARNSTENGSVAAL
eukprot:CAMPEP_0173395368 /NCGR_PEP_ID=MMETSP1356-20130122/31823_1 /TAXON_ID=77927 ORGANISM="Hemiselmis virescens, Strain PCC157" /NCGR_SAMPLE_ID=MMETSP1356 /ASSEMBLY_ACC=CAM_ASM_000847 /LENGTH=34 /DNA_ID= /DNA_START= /DNA_END= /DNA_ORIENTATION=